MSYIKTDDSQWVERIDENEFNLVEVRRLTTDSYTIAVGTVDLTEYSDAEIDNSLQSYGYKDFDGVCLQYGSLNTGKQITAECLFEDTPTNELFTFGPYKSEDEAIERADKFIQAQERIIE